MESNREKKMNIEIGHLNYFILEALIIFASIVQRIL